MATSGNAAMRSMSNSELDVCRLARLRNQYVRPSTTMPRAPHGLENAFVLMLTRLTASRPDRMSSFMATSTPWPRDAVAAATTTAS